MKTRLAGVVLIGCGILFAVLFVYLPIRDGPGGFMGGIRPNALVFIPLAVVTGLAFLIGGTSGARGVSGPAEIEGPDGPGALDHHRLRRVDGLGYWQIKTRWMRAPEPVISRWLTPGADIAARQMDLPHQILW
jgi:hypothetical protein